MTHDTRATISAVDNQQAANWSAPPLLDLDSLDEFLRGERAAPAQLAREPLTPARARLIVGRGVRGR